MKKVLIISILFLIGIVHVKGQSGGFHIYTGAYYNTFNQNELRGLQSSFNNMIMGSQKSTEFPNFVSFEAGVLKDIGVLHLGIFGAYQSTGARNVYTDFSGFLTTEFALDAYSFGVAGRYQIKESKFHLITNIGLIFNEVEIDQELQVFDDNQSVSGTYRSQNMVIQLGVAYRILKQKPTVSLVGLFDVSEFGGELELFSNTAGWPDDATIPYKVDWTGIKMGIQIGLDFL